MATQFKRRRELFSAVCQTLQTSEAEVSAESLGFASAPLCYSLKRVTFSSPPLFPNPKFGGEWGREILSHALEQLHVKAGRGLLQRKNIPRYEFIFLQQYKMDKVHPISYLIPTLTC